jgi:hypothetical protein
METSVLTLLAGLSDTLPVVRVDDEDDTLGVLEVYMGQFGGLVPNKPDKNELGSVEVKFEQVS